MEYIGDSKKYKYHFETIEKMMFDFEMKYLLDTHNRINRIICIIERITDKINK